MKFRKLISCLAAVSMLTATVPMAFAADDATNAETVHQINASGTTVFEVEELFDVNTTNRITEDEKASGGQYWYEYYAGTAIDKTVTFEVEDTSEYTLEMVANKRAGNLSYIMLYVDGVMYIKNWDSQGTETEIAGPYMDTAESNYTGNLRKYSSDIVLTKGTHTLNLQMPHGSVPRAAGGIDTISFTKNLTKTLDVGKEKAVFEYEDIWSKLIGSAKIVEDENASGGKYLTNGTDGSYGKKNHAKVNVAEDGLYKINFVMEQNGDFISFIALTIDGETVIRNVLYSESAYAATELTGAASTKLNDYYAYAYLTKGTHDLIIDFFDYSKKNNTRHAYSFDSLTFEKMTPAVLSEDGGKIEAEGNFGGMPYNGTVTENENASGGSIILRKTGLTENETLVGMVDVKKAGFYNIALYANKWEGYLSAVALKVDGNQVLKSSGGAKGEVLSPAYPETYNIAKHKAASPVYLTAGVHKLDVVFEPRTEQKNIAYSFDYVEFTPDSTELEFTSDIEDLAEAPFFISDDEEVDGDTVTVYLNGSAISNGTYQITYKSSNEEVMTIDADGNITPKAAGYSDISVEVGVSGNTLATFSARMYVLDENHTKYIANAKYASGKVTFDAIVDEEDGGFAANGFVAVYTGTTLSDVKTVTLTEDQSEGYEVSVTANSGDKIMIFVWDENNAPVWFATEVK